MSSHMVIYVKNIMWDVNIMVITAHLEVDKINVRNKLYDIDDKMLWHYYACGTYKILNK